MFKELMYKWFGVEPTPCLVCEALREQLYKSEAERRELLRRVLAPPSTEPAQEIEEDPVPIMPPYRPWRMRREMYEAEDRKKAQLIKEHKKALDDASKTDTKTDTRGIDELEKELGVSQPDDVKV